MKKEERKRKSDETMKEERVSIVTLFQRYYYFFSYRSSRSQLQCFTILLVSTSQHKVHQSLDEIRHASELL